jgi:hypothetical protein
MSFPFASRQSRERVMDPFALCLQALEDAHERYLRALRAHAVLLLDLGCSAEVVEGLLGPIERLESEQDVLVGLLREMA